MTATPNTSTPASVKWPALLIALAASLICYLLLPVEPLVRAGLTITLLIGLLWLTEAIDITFTALLVPVLAMAFQIMPAKQAFADFANPVIFLFMGGFALAAALTRHGIDREIGQAVLKIAGTHPLRAAYLLFAATAFMSMWISNTATAAMMLPVALGVASRFHDPQHRNAIFLLLGTAYAASIGGMATLVGSPPNAIAAANQSITFVQWLQFGLPLALLLMPLLIVLLRLLLKPDFALLTEAAPVTEATPASSGRQDRRRTFTLLIFAAVVCGWIFSGPLSRLTGIAREFDAWVAVVGMLALGLSGAIKWEDAEKKTSWGILLLFGGGMTLSTVLEQTGTSVFIAAQLKDLVAGAPPLLAILVMVAFIVFLSELVSNTACAALLIPLLVPVSAHFGLPPMVLAVVVALAASSSFMLPVATPPNAIVFGTGLIPQRVMMRCGFFLNLICISLISVAAVLFWK